MHKEKRNVWLHSIVHPLSIFFANLPLNLWDPHRFNGRFANLLYGDEQWMYTRMQPNISPKRNPVIIIFNRELFPSYKDNSLRYGCKPDLVSSEQKGR